MLTKQIAENLATARNSNSQSIIQSERERNRDLSRVYKIWLEISQTHYCEKRNKIVGRKIKKK